MLQVMRPFRLWNAMKLYSGYHYSKWVKRPVQRALPVSISIEPTTSCNLRCPECPSGLRQFSRPTGMMSEELFRRITDQVKSHVMYMNFYFQGEPFLNTKLTDMIKYASRKGIYTSTSTNAHYLDPAMAEQVVKSGLDRLIISIDGSTQETYSAYRVGGILSKVIEGTQNMVDAKKKLRSRKPHIVFQMLVVKPNEHQVRDVQRMADKLGVDEFLVKTAQVYEYENGNELIPDNEEYSRYKMNDSGRWELKNELEDHCWKMWHSCVITWDGSVVPCCFDKDAHHKLGTLKTFSFKEIWFSEPYRKFRAAVLSGRKEIDICRNCSEGSHVYVGGD